MSARGKLVLDGTNDFVSTSYAGISGAGVRTVCGWVKAASGDGGQVLSYGDVTNDEAFRFAVPTGTDVVQFSCRGTSVNGSSDVADGTWHFIAIAYDGGDMLVYADSGAPGSEVVEENSLTRAINTGTDVAVRIGMGEWGGGDFGPGEISDIMFFDDNLSLAELQAIYDLGRNPDHGQVAGLAAYGDLVSWWPFTINANDEKGSNQGSFEDNAYVDIEANVPVAIHNYQNAGAL